MAAEAPICTRTVNSLPDHRIQTAAYLGLFAMALFIESPVIDLLGTSTTLSVDRSSFDRVRRFSFLLMAWCGLVHLAVATTPLFDVVFYGVLKLPKEVGEACRAPLLVMVPWSPAIGLRRHVQGLLIRRGTTAAIGQGTVLRVATIGLVAWGLSATGQVSGALVAAWALSASVVVEAAFIYVVGMRTLANVEWPEGATTTTTADLLRFHIPLTVSTMFMLTSMPLVTRSMNSLPDSILSMNGWQVSMTLAFLFRTMTFALPEVVIANYRERDGSGLLFRFCLTIGAGLSGAMVLMSLAEWDTAFFRYVTGADTETAHSAHQAFFASSLLPLIGALASYAKGVLTLRKVTTSRLAATIVSLLALFAALQVGIWSNWPGVLVGALAVTVSSLAELGVLVVSLKVPGFGANFEKT